MSCKPCEKMKRVTKKVGKYELGRTIGKGTFAKVKFAKNTETGESVAIKVLPKSSILKHKMVDQVLLLYLLKCLYTYSVDVVYILKLIVNLQIKREISITKMMRHPNIVRLREVYLYYPIYLILYFLLFIKKINLVLGFVKPHEDIYNTGIHQWRRAF